MTSSTVCVGPASTASIPPACSRLRANPARGAYAASGPRVARKAVGRVPVAAQDGVGAVAEGLERRGWPVDGQAAGPARPVPPAGPRRCAGPASRAGRGTRSPRSAASGGSRRRPRPTARTAATRSATSPESSAATAPPAASSSWKNAHAARASSSVSDSTNHEPPAGSITRARCASMTSSDWVLRAIRRENGVDEPSAASNGATVTASAPPTPAAKPATVPRSRFTYGSRRRVHRRGRDRVHRRRPRRGVRPRSPPAPAPTGGGRRAASRWSGTARRWPRTATPAGGRRRRRRAGGGERAQVSTPAARRRSRAPGRPTRPRVHRQAVDDHGAHLREARRHAQGERDDGPDVRARSGPGPDARRGRGPACRAARPGRRGRTQLQVRLRGGLRLGPGSAEASRTTGARSSSTPSRAPAGRRPRSRRHRPRARSTRRRSRDRQDRLAAPSGRGRRATGGRPSRRGPPRPAGSRGRTGAGRAPRRPGARRRRRPCRAGWTAMPSGRGPGQGLDAGAGPARVVEPAGPAQHLVDRRDPRVPVGRRPVDEREVLRLVGCVAVECRAVDLRGVHAPPPLSPDRPAGAGPAGGRRPRLAGARWAESMQRAGSPVQVEIRATRRRRGGPLTPGKPGSYRGQTWVRARLPVCRRVTRGRSSRPPR